MNPILAQSFLTRLEMDWVHQNFMVDGSSCVTNG